MKISEQFKHINELISDIIDNRRTRHITMSMAADDVKRQILEGEQSFYTTTLTPQPRIKYLVLEIALEPHRMNYADMMQEWNLDPKTILDTISVTSIDIPAFTADYIRHLTPDDRLLMAAYQKPHKNFSALLESDLEIIEYYYKTKDLSMNNALTMYDALLPHLEKLNKYRSKFKLTLSEAIELVESNIAENHHYSDTNELLPQFQTKSKVDDTPTYNKVITTRVKTAGDEEAANMIIAAAQAQVKKAEGPFSPDDDVPPLHIRGGRGTRRRILSLNEQTLAFQTTGNNPALIGNQNLLTANTNLVRFPAETIAFVGVITAIGAAAIYYIKQCFFKPAKVEKQVAKEAKLQTQLSLK